MVKPTKFYRREKPEKDELVRIIMGDMDKDRVMCELVDYNSVGILPITELTNKKRFNKRRGTIRSYHIKNQVVAATILDISDDNIFLSRKYINESKDDMDVLDRNNNNLISFINQLTHNITKIENREKYDNLLKRIVEPLRKQCKGNLVLYMSNNLKLIQTLVNQEEFYQISDLLDKSKNNNIESFMKQLNHRLNKDFLQNTFDSLWKLIVYPIMDKIEDTNVIEYITKNPDEIKNLVDENYHDEILDLLVKYKEIIKKNSKIKKEELEFQLVSQKGISVTKKLISEIVNRYDNISFYYETAPTYVISVIESQGSELDLVSINEALEDIKGLVDNDDQYKGCFIKIN